MAGRHCSAVAGSVRPFRGMPVMAGPWHGLPGRRRSLGHSPYDPKAGRPRYTALVVTSASRRRGGPPPMPSVSSVPKSGISNLSFAGRRTGRPVLGQTRSLWRNRAPRTRPECNAAAVLVASPLRRA